MFILYKKTNSVRNATHCSISAFSRCLPTTIFEREYPDGITELPTIRCNGQQFSGLTEVVGFFERMSNVQDLLAKATEWKKRI